jgi:hypothetical protein
MKQQKYRHLIEHGKKKVILDLAGTMSDPMTLKEMAKMGELKDGLYEGGDDRIYHVTGEKVKLLPQFSSRYDFKKGKYIITERLPVSQDVRNLPIFHGTPFEEVRYDNFDIKRSGQNYRGVGGNEFEAVYFSTIPSDAEGYGRIFGGKKGQVVEATINPRAKIISYKDTYYSSGEPKYTEDLLKEGVDVVTKYKKGGDYGEVIVLNPKVLDMGKWELSVKDALSKGKRVPTKVLKDYYKVSRVK